MSWRTIHIQNPCHISCKNGQAHIKQDNGCADLPLEDIAIIVLESPQVLLSSSFLSATQSRGICVVSCDERHMPNGVMTGFHQHSRQAEIASIQINASQPLAKRLWQKIIQQKINNQSACLGLYGKSDVKALSAMAGRVKSGDPDNMEALAARAYWISLLGDEFKRHQDDYLNHALNYGYAIIRATIARAVVAAGLLPCIGVHHANNLNAFNLVDDLIEPYRPFCDAMVFKMNEKKEATHIFDKNDRQRLAGLTGIDVSLDGESHNLLNASVKTAESLVTSFRTGRIDFLKLPSLANLDLTDA